MKNDFLYLNQEDEATAKAFGIVDENDALAVYGGLKSYVDFTTNRDTARLTQDIANEGQTYSVPKLPQNINDAMSRIPANMGIKEIEMYKQLVREQMEKVQGIMDAIRFNKGFKAEIARADKEKAARKTADIKRYAGQNPYGWPAESISALEWGLGEWQRQNKTFGL